MGEVPEWSGAFWTSPDGRRGFMEVHINDTRQHQPPVGWRLSDVVDEAIDSAVFVYRRIA